MDGEVFEPGVNDDSEKEAKAADGDSPGEEGMPADGIGEESGLVEVGHAESGFIGGGDGREEEAEQKLP